MTSWDCRIEVTRSTVVEAENADQARHLAVDWFFYNCINAVGESDVIVDPIGGAE